MKNYQDNEAMRAMMNHPDILELKQVLDKADSVILNALPQTAYGNFVDYIFHRNVVLDYCLCHGYHTGLCEMLGKPLDDGTSK